MSTPELEKPKKSLRSIITDIGKADFQLNTAKKRLDKFNRSGLDDTDGIVDSHIEDVRLSLLNKGKLLDVLNTSVERLKLELDLANDQFIGAKITFLIRLRDLSAEEHDHENLHIALTGLEEFFPEEEELRDQFLTEYKNRFKKFLQSLVIDPEALKSFGFTDAAIGKIICLIEDPSSGILKKLQDWKQFQLPRATSSGKKADVHLKYTVDGEKSPAHYKIFLMIGDGKSFATVIDSMSFQ